MKLRRNGELPAGQEVDVQRIEIVRSDPGLSHPLGIRGRPALQNDGPPGGEGPSIHGRFVGPRHDLYPRQSPNALGQGLEIFPCSRLRVSNRPEVARHQQEGVGLKTHLLTNRIPKALHQEPGPREEDQRKGDLGRQRQGSARSRRPPAGR